MPRIRTIKPSFFKNEQLADLAPQVRLLFIGLWTLADKEGKLEDRPKRIKVELFPYDNFEIDDLLKRLQNSGFIQRYEVNDLKVIKVVNFRKHQRITGSEVDTQSEFPDPESEGKLLETFGNTEETPRTTGKEGKGYIGKEGKGSANGANVSFFLENDEKHKNKTGPPGDFSAEINLYWQRWKDFKAKEFGFLYKSEVSEKASVEKLFRLSNGNPSTAKQLICSAIENGWKSFYSEKNSKEDKKEEIKNKSPDELKTDVQFVYELFLEGREVSKLIEPVYFDFLQLTFNQDIKTEAWKKRINQLTGSNHAAINKLREAYETYDPENKLVGDDKQKFDDLAKRIAVFNHFKKLQQQGKEALFYVE